MTGLMRLFCSFRWPRSVAALFATAICMTAGGGAHSQTLNTIKQRGSVTCGVSQGVVGFSAQSGNREWVGFDVDFCRALSAAIFNDAGKVSFSPVSANDRFHALQSGDIDLLSRDTTWTMSREVDLGLEFAAVTYYDGQGFMVPRSRNSIQHSIWVEARSCAERHDH